VPAHGQEIAEGLQLPASALVSPGFAFRTRTWGIAVADQQRGNLSGASIPDKAMIPAIHVKLLTSRIGPVPLWAVISPRRRREWWDWAGGRGTGE
jgi:hypothetical protein